MAPWENIELLAQPVLGWVRQNLLDWFVLLQLALAASVGLIAYWVSKWLRPRVEGMAAPWLARWHLDRLAAVLSESLAWLVFLTMLWLAIGIMREVTWPSRSYMLGVFAALASAWIVIRLLSAVIYNAVLARAAAFIVWSLAALNITGLFGPFIAILDQAALRIGGSRVSLLTVLGGGGLLALLLWLAITAGRLIERRMHGVQSLSPSMQVLLSQLAKFGLVAFAVLFALDAVGVDVSAFALFSGALGLGVGFGLQKVVSNLVSGIILLLDRSIKPGDVIEVGETFGWINTLGARYVSVVSRDGKEYLIPNDDLITQRMVNWSFSNRLVRLDVRVGIDYSSDIRKARQIIVEAIKKPARILAHPDPVCHIAGFGDSSVDLLLRFWITDPERGVANIKGEVLQEVWDALRAHGIGIPFPHREVILRQAPPLGPGQPNPG